MKDLTPIIKKFEELLKEWYETDKTIGMAISLTLPPKYKDVHWITNLDREDGITLLENTTQKMKDLRNKN